MVMFRKHKEGRQPPVALRGCACWPDHPDPGAAGDRANRTIALHKPRLTTSTQWCPENRPMSTRRPDKLAECCSAGGPCRYLAPDIIRIVTTREKRQRKSEKQQRNPGVV